MTYFKKAIYGAVIVFVFSIISAFFGYLFRLLLARNLNPGEYGLFYAVLSLILFINSFREFGLRQAIIKRIPEFLTRKDDSSIRKSIFIVLFLWILTSLIVFIAVNLFAKPLALNYFNSSNAILLLFLFTFMFIFNPIDAMFSYVFRGFQKMGYASSLELIRSLFYVIFTFIGFMFFTGPYVPAFVYAGTPLIITIMFLPIIKRKLFHNKKMFEINFDPKIIKNLFFFGFPVMLSGMGFLILHYTDTLLITFFLDLESVGQYQVALPTANLLIYFSTAITAVLLPMVSELWAKNLLGSLKKGIILAYKYVFIIVIPPAIVMFSYPKIILNLLFGSNYTSASTVLMILAISSIFLTISNINFSILSGIGKPKKTAQIMFVAAISNIILNIILIPKQGLVGAAIATAISYLIMGTSSVFFLKKNIDVKIPFFNLSKIFLNGFIFIGIVHLLKRMIDINVWAEMFLVLSVSSAVYIGLLFLLRIIDLHEIFGYIKTIRK